MGKQLPGDGVFGWLGRQIGYVKNAVKTQPTARKPMADSPADRVSDKPEVIFREDKVEEAEHPTAPGLRLRRTVIDEVVRDPQPRKEGEEK